MWHITQFGTVTLPPYNEVHQMDVVPAISGNVATLGGGFDRWGNATAPQQFPQTITAQLTVAEDTKAATRAAVDVMRSKIGQRNILYRQSLEDCDTGDVQWAYARILSIPVTRQIDQWESQPLQLAFEQYTNWHGQQHGSWLLDDGYYLDMGLFLDATDDSATLSASPGTVPVTNAGNMPVYDAVVTITAGSAAITALDVKCGTVTHWTYSGTIGAGNSLVVDTGAWSVENDGADAIAGFAFGASHRIPAMLELAPGANSFVVTFTGGSTNSTFDISFWDTYA